VGVRCFNLPQGNPAVFLLEMFELHHFLVFTLANGLDETGMVIPAQIWFRLYKPLSPVFKEACMGFRAIN
jgi:hypothetical protein